MESGQAQCGALTAIKETTTKGRESLTEEEDRTPPPPPGSPKTSQPDTGPRSEAISEHTTRW